MRARTYCQLFPVITAIVISWAFCAILTVTGVFTDDPDKYGYTARTDVKLTTLSVTPWARFPYPFQWGLPTFSFSGFSFLAGVLAGIIESIGDYYACARLAGTSTSRLSQHFSLRNQVSKLSAGAPPPPGHAVNRGIGMEGIGCILAGIWGTGSGTTSYSGNRRNLTKAGKSVFGCFLTSKVAKLLKLVRNCAMHMLHT